MLQHVDESLDAANVVLSALTVLAMPVLADRAVGVHRLAGLAE